MDDSEGGLSFDFEGGLDAAPTNSMSSTLLIHSDSAAPTALAAGVAASGGGGIGTASDPSTGHYNNRRSFRQTVCRHWLRSLCMKGDACGFLHQYDKSRMPICRFFRMYGECREQDCVYKHTNEDIKECNMYKLGFCPNGPDCRYRHVKLPGPPPPVEEVLQKIQYPTTLNYNNNSRFPQNRNSGHTQQQPEKSQFPPNSHTNNQSIASNRPTTESPNLQVQKAQQSVDQFQSIPNDQVNRTVPVSRYFIVKSCNRENFELSVQQGVWATQRSNEAKLNEAFDSVENVVLIFSINRTRHFQGCAKMTSKIGGFVGGGNWKYAHGTAHYGRNFSVKWLKLCELSFQKTRHLRNPYNENLPVKISRDCQELEPSVGEQLDSLLRLEPDSELMEISVAAESKREEEKAKGVSSENVEPNPDIVPFEDNEEEEYEESEDDEDQILTTPGHGRGMMWQPHMPPPRAFPGMRPPFPPNNMMMPSPDGLFVPMPNLYPGAFPPRFSGDFMGPGMMHVRPQFPGGFGMMGRPGPFIGPNPGRTGRPGLPPVFPPPPQRNNPNRSVRRDRDDRSEDKKTDTGNYEKTMEDYSRNEESESEDEAPRRSRPGEGKNKR